MVRWAEPVGFTAAPAARRGSTWVKAAFVRPGGGWRREMNMASWWQWDGSSMAALSLDLSRGRVGWECRCYMMLLGTG